MRWKTVCWRERTLPTFPSTKPDIGRTDNIIILKMFFVFNDWINLADII